MSTPQISAAGKKYYAANKAEKLAYEKARYRKNRCKKLAYQKAYAAAHKAEVTAYQKSLRKRKKRLHLCGCKAPVMLGKTSCADCQWKLYPSVLRRGAKQRGLRVGVSDAFLRRLSKQPCHYCGGMDDKGFNGIDRKDSKRGYVLSNMVPCCWLHNQMKSTLTYETFLDGLLAAASYLQAQQNNEKRNSASVSSESQLSS